MASTPPTVPDLRTAADDGEDATAPAPGVGISSPDPAEGPDERPEPGSPAG